MNFLCRLNSARLKLEGFPGIVCVQCNQKVLNVPSVQRFPSPDLDRKISRSLSVLWRWKNLIFFENLEWFSCGWTSKWLAVPHEPFSIRWNYNTLLKTLVNSSKSAIQTQETVKILSEISNRWRESRESEKETQSEKDRERKGDVLFECIVKISFTFRFGYRRPSDEWETFPGMTIGILSCDNFKKFVIKSFFAKKKKFQRFLKNAQKINKLK